MQNKSLLSPQLFTIFLLFSSFIFCFDGNAKIYLLNEFGDIEKAIVVEGHHKKVFASDYTLPNCLVKEGPCLILKVIESSQIIFVQDSLPPEEDNKYSFITAFDEVGNGLGFEGQELTILTGSEFKQQVKRYQFLNQLTEEETGSKVDTNTKEGNNITSKTKIALQIFKNLFKKKRHE